MAQSRLVAAALSQACPGLRVEFVPILTRGDRATGPLTEAGGKALFTEELEAGLLEGKIDVAVHSAKDLPIALAEGTEIAAVPARADARDALLSSDGLGPGQLPISAMVGTGSLRRAALLLSVRPDLRIVPLRGNVDTRIRRVIRSRNGEERLDAAVIAMAGVIRLGLMPSLEERLVPLDAAAFIPAAGQGAVAVQSLSDCGGLSELLRLLDDPPSHQALLAEREVVRAMGADCHSCLAVHVGCYSGAWRGWAMASRVGSVGCDAPGSQDVVRVEGSAPGREMTDGPSRIAEQLVSALDAGGARDFLG